MEEFAYWRCRYVRRWKTTQCVHSDCRLQKNREKKLRFNYHIKSYFNLFVAIDLHRCRAVAVASSLFFIYFYLHINLHFFLLLLLLLPLLLCVPFPIQIGHTRIFSKYRGVIITAAIMFRRVQLDDVRWLQRLRVYS